MSVVEKAEVKTYANVAATRHQSAEPPMNGDSSSPPAAAPKPKNGSDSADSQPNGPTSPNKSSKRGSGDDLSDRFNPATTISRKGSVKENVAETESNAKNKGKKGFLTDREYLHDDHEGNKELEAWQPDPDVPLGRGEDRVEGKGWSVQEMFRANDKLGVQSSFNGIEEYSTAEPEGDEEARRKADIIASQIERNAESSRYAMLENDDEERDLDKETKFDQRNRKPGQPRGGAGGQRQQQGTGTGPGRPYANGLSQRGHPNAANSAPRGGGGSYSQQGPAQMSNRGGDRRNQRAAPPQQWRVEQPTVSKAKSPPTDDRQQSASPATRRPSTGRTAKPQIPAVAERLPDPQQQQPSTQSVPPTPPVEALPFSTNPQKAGPSTENKDSKKFSFNPDAIPFVPKTRLPMAAPPQQPQQPQSMPLTIGTAQQQMVPHGYGHMQLPMGPMSMHQNLLIPQQPHFPPMQHQQPHLLHNAQYPQYQQNIQQIQSQMSGHSIPQSQSFTGVAAGSHPFQGMPQMVQQQQQLNYPNVVYGSAYNS